MRAFVTESELLRDFSGYLDRVISRGERLVLTRHGKEIAELGPARTVGRTLGDPAGAPSSLPRLGEQEAARFARDVDRARSSGQTVLPGSPWEL